MLDRVSGAFWRIAHNAVAHPLMLVLPERLGTRLHDETARRAWPAADAEAQLLAAARRYARANASMPGECTHGEEWFDSFGDHYSVICDACTPTDDQCTEYEAAMCALMDAAADLVREGEVSDG